MKYECQLCKKGCNQIRVDITLEKQKRFWTCDKCYFGRNKKTKKYGKHRS